MNQGTVLIVEDDPSLAEALCDTLDLAGYPVVAAGDGSAALEVLDLHNVAMVVSDVRMRPMDGHALLKRIRAARPDLPVVLMTAYGTIDKAVSAMHEAVSRSSLSGRPRFLMMPARLWHRITPDRSCRR